MDALDEIIQVPAIAIAVAAAEPIDAVIWNDEPPAPSPPPVFNWTLDKKDWTTTIFAKKKMREHANFRKVCGFISSGMGISYADLKRYDGMPSEIKTELDLITNYKNKFNKKQKHFAVAHSLPKHKWGRTMPSGYLSLSVFHRPSRHGFCLEIYRDLDIANAHPQFIYDINLQHGNTLSALKKYVDDPKGWRRKICEHHGLDYSIDAQKDIAKNLPISLMYGGGYSSWIRENNIDKNADRPMPMFQAIEREMSLVMETVYTANPQIVKDVLRHDPQKWRNEGEKKRGVMALWAQTIERRLMEEATMFLVEHKGCSLEDIVPCQDGLMILADLYYDGIEADLARLSAHKYGFNLKWVDKAFDEAIDIPLYNDIRSAEEWEIALDVKELSVHLLAMKVGDYMMGDFIRRSADTDGRVFIYYGTRWYDETEAKNRHHFTKYISENLYANMLSILNTAVELTAEELSSMSLKLRNTTSNGTCVKTIQLHALCNAKPLPECGFDAKPLLLGFNNGVMDLPTKTFRPYRFDDYITLTTGYDYSLPTDAVMRVTLLKILAEIQEKDEHRRLLLQIFASALDGNNYQAMWFLNGTGGNGKGLLAGLIMAVLGSNYCLFSQGGILKEVARANSPSPDIADLRYKRYIYFTEMGGSIILTALRRLTGGAVFTGRQLNKGNVSFPLSATIAGEFNTPPEFDVKCEEADYRRIRDMKFGNNWSTDPEKVGKTINGITYKQADPYYATPEFTECAKLTFLDILLDMYVGSFSVEKRTFQFDIPDDIWRASKSMCDDTNLFKIMFERLYEPCPAKATDEKKAVVDHQGKRVITYPNRIYFGDIWDTIQYDDEYKTGKRQKNREFTKSWGKGNLYKWLIANLDCRTNTINHQEYILGYQLGSDAHTNSFVENDEVAGTDGEIASSDAC